jgi:hypothetical protein
MFTSEVSRTNRIACFGLWLQPANNAIGLDSYSSHNNIIGASESRMDGLSLRDIWANGEYNDRDLF